MKTIIILHVFILLVTSGSASDVGHDYDYHDYHEDGEYDGNYDSGDYNESYIYDTGQYGDYDGDYDSYYDYGDTRGEPKQDNMSSSRETINCGGEITELPSSILKTPGYPSEGNRGGVYPNDAYCKWWFNGDELTLVRFKLWALAIQLGEGGSNKTCDFDYLNVTITSIGSQRFCGHTTPESELRGKGSLVIIFVSDSSENYRGMQGLYQITEDFDPCDPSPCSRHGTCEVLPDLVSVRCVCDPGFSGQKCEIDIDECESSPCLNGGNCSDKMKPNYYECTCELGWEGDRCEIKIMNPCIPNPCQNGGTCRNHSETTFSCNCTEHYIGQNCENENFPPCFSDPCENDGVCVDSTAEVKYRMVPAPEGSDEEFVEAKAPPEYLGFDCTCDLARFRGELCEIAAGCGNPGIAGLDGGHWFEPNSTVRFSCVGDYILVGSENTTCFADGTWSEPPPGCVVNETAAAMKQEGPITPWIAAMMALGAIFAVALVAFASWMIAKRPWSKMNRIISISHISLSCRDDTGNSSLDDDDSSYDATSSGSYSSSSSSMRDVP